MIRTLIVEDEPAEAQRLTEYVRRYGDARGETFQITWLKSAMEMLSDKSPYDLVLLDIDLPGISGMEAAQLLRVYDETTPIIFVTNLAKYAVKGYEVDALDFIVKPITYFNFRMRMDKAMRHIRRNAGHSVMVSTRDGMRVIPMADIEYVEVSRHDLSYHIYGEKDPFVVYGSLVAFEEEVAGGPFVRISNSCLVNMNHIRSVKGPALLLRSGETLYFSRSRKREAVETITEFLGGSI